MNVTERLTFVTTGASGRVQVSALGGVTVQGEAEAESKRCLPVPIEELWVTHHISAFIVRPGSFAELPTC